MLQFLQVHFFLQILDYIHLIGVNNKMYINMYVSKT